MGKNKRETVLNIILAGFCMLTVMSLVPRLLIGMDVDEQYAMTLIYRLAKGDIPVIEMWEPHQTSAFLPAVFTCVYMKIIGGTDYLCLFLRVLGLVFQGITATLWYICFNKKYGRWIAGITALVILNVTPKWIQSPEFANTQIWWLLLLAMAIYKYDGTNKKIYELLAGCCMVFETLAYPSTVIMFPVIIGYLIYRKKKCYLFVLVPILSALGFLTYLLSKAPIKTLIQSAKYILSDEEHSVGFASKMIAYLGEIPCIALELLIIALIAFVIIVVIKLIFRNKINKDIVTAVLIVVAIADQMFNWLVIKGANVHPQLFYLLIFAVGYCYYKDMDLENKRVWIMVSILSLLSLVSVLILTNLDMKASFAHLLPGVLCVVLIWGSNTIRQDKAAEVMSIIAASALLFVITFGRTYLVRSNEGMHNDIWLVRQKALYTAAKNEYFAYMDGYNYNCNYENLRSLVSADDKVLYVGTEKLIYPEFELEVCEASTISTPVYNSRYVEYYRMNPDKEPDYILMSKNYEENITDIEFIKWLANKEVIYVE